MRPHYELISELLQVSGEQLFADVAKDILLYVSRDLSDKVSYLLCVCVYLTSTVGTRCPHLYPSVMSVKDTV